MKTRSASRSASSSAVWDTRFWLPIPGQQALTIASQFEQPIDLMITDLVMPKMSGRELSQSLGSIRPQMRTIFMSGYTDDAVMRHGVQEDGVAFLQKPFSLAVLARKVLEMLDSPLGIR